ncbi:hypothetical protein V6N13_142400 [Hibiscus sabdariffa]|uniref:DUF4283 domain-containing protein n=1 Tax=Hibiscus sabdariffa TaxID=183260 RepID=A0ABR2FE26_9ROSI
MKLRKLRVWISLEGLPLEAWNEYVLSFMGSRWGDVIRLDQDTVERNRFDVARILIGVKCLSTIPPFLPIVLNGEKFCLKVSIAAFEDERCWIDNKKMNGFAESSPESLCDSPGRSCMGKELYDDFKVLENVEKTIAFNTKRDKSGSSSSRARLEYSNNISRVVFPIQHDLGPDFWPEGNNRPAKEVGVPSRVGIIDSETSNGRDQLFEVCVEGGSDSNELSGHSVSIEPVFYLVSGLYSVKLIPLYKGNLFSGICSKFNNRYQWMVVSPFHCKIHSSGKENVVHLPEGVRGKNLSKHAAKN